MNRLPLSTILGFIVSIIGGLIGIALIEIMDNSRSGGLKNEEMAIMTSTFFGMLLFLFTGIGLILQKKWARIIALSIIYFCLITLTIVFLVGLIFERPNRLEEAVIIFSMFMFAYSFLICTLILLNHRVVKEEFGISST